MVFIAAIFMISTHTKFCSTLTISFFSSLACYQLSRSLCGQVVVCTLSVQDFWLPFWLSPSLSTFCVAIVHMCMQRILLTYSSFVHAPSY